jgi:hypothetical protein
VIQPKTKPLNPNLSKFFPFQVSLGFSPMFHLLLFLTPKNFNHKCTQQTKSCTTQSHKKNTNPLKVQELKTHTSQMHDKKPCVAQNTRIHAPSTLCDCCARQKHQTLHELICYKFKMKTCFIVHYFSLA